MIVSEKNWETLLEGTEDSPFIRKEAADLQRFILGNAYDAQLDSKGRCVLPTYLREYANITDDLVFGGMNTYIEVWNKKDWEEEQERLSKHIPEIAEKLLTPAPERVGK
jgi:MraZ protein